MTDSLSSEFNAFHSACLENNLKKVRETVTYSFLNQADTDGNTALHIASSKGYTELVQLLFRYHANRTLRNNKGLTAEEVAENDEMKNLFKVQMRPKTDTKYLGKTNEVEWIDSYKNAYRISYENREHMKRWLLKVPLRKLLDEIDTGYIDKMKLSNEKCKQEVKDYLKVVIESKNLAELVRAYTSGGTGFCTKLNYDLAEIGSNFRFLSTQNLFNSGYLDNEAPKGLGQYIFAAILINHPVFQAYHHKGIIYRGMSLTLGELAEYDENQIIMTRSFLSTSKNQDVAKFFLPGSGDIKQPININENQPTNQDTKIPVMCIYEVINPRTSLNIEKLSIFEEEEEVLIVPFAVFQIIKIDGVVKNSNNQIIKIEGAEKTEPVTIYLRECDSNLV